MNKFIIALSAALLPLAAHAGGDAALGKQKADQVCAACHAVGGDWTKPLQPEYPRLAGQHQDYIVTALTEYKQGDKSLIGRKNPIMAGQAAALSAEDIDNVAAYLSGLHGTLHVKR
jgi:cytochrome c553